MAHYHFSSAGAQEVLLSMRSIHATFLLRTSEHFTAVLSHNLMNVINSLFFSIRLSNATFVKFCLLVFIWSIETPERLRNSCKKIVSEMSVIRLLISFYRPWFIPLPLYRKPKSTFVVISARSNGSSEIFKCPRNFSMTLSRNLVLCCWSALRIKVNLSL